MRSRRGLRVQLERALASPWLEGAELARATPSLALFAVALSRGGCDSFELGRAFPRALGGARGRRDRTWRPIDFCTPKPFPLEHPCSVVFPAQRPFVARAHLSVRVDALVRSRSIPGPCGSVLVHANVFLRVFPLQRRSSEDARRRDREARGPPIRDEAGENRASRRVSHFGFRAIKQEGVVSPRA
jgi:hypothetical protein